MIVHHYTLYTISSLYKSDTIASNMRQQGAATAGIQLRVLSAGGRSFPICHLWPLNVKMMIVMSEMTKGRLVIRNLSLACQRVSILNSVVERFDGSTRGEYFYSVGVPSLQVIFFLHAEIFILWCIVQKYWSGIVTCLWNTSLSPEMEKANKIAQIQKRTNKY